MNCVKARFEQKDYINCYAKVEGTLLLAAKDKPFDEYVLPIRSFMEMTWTNIISTRNF